MWKFHIPRGLLGVFLFITLNDFAKKRGLRVYRDRISTANLKNSTAMSAASAQFSNYNYMRRIAFENTLCWQQDMETNF